VILSGASKPVFAVLGRVELEQTAMNACLQVLDFLYFPALLLALETFNCAHAELNNSSSSSSSLSFMVAAPYVTCSGAGFETRFALAALGGSVLVVGSLLRKAWELKAVACCPARVSWRALLHEEVWLLVCKLMLTCLLALIPDSVFVPVVILMLILVSIAAHVRESTCCVLAAAAAVCHKLYRCAVQRVCDPWTKTDKLKLWLLGVLLFSYLSWLMAGLSVSFSGVSALATLVSLVRACVFACVRGCGQVMIVVV